MVFLHCTAITPSHVCFRDHLTFHFDLLFPSLMVRYITQKEAIAIDEALLETGYDINSLIEVAGLCAFDVITAILKEREDGIHDILVVCGPGNNGSDGLVIARCLKLSGYNVTVFYKRLKHQNLVNIAKNVGVAFTTDWPKDVHRYGCIIDAMFGFSFKPPLREPFSSIVECISEHSNVLSIDVPSGYEIDNEDAKYSFVPRHVVCFVAPKVCTKMCRSIFITRCFVPRYIYDDDNDYSRFKRV
ncbi:hypothetical protein VCUG_01070 [Vavraia culicis subsp. floridensis]|uniref:NAD(P)H-hydrate epimerase n=1 Tax=Vavraia culicis (isolate floridensis) TaxID=948595 RepID=L2GUX9_VAVCU|nr:uncharacterized protein VCUG_01070 [Vavraia culicis subsp. floridensis]ELA47419.1 hypothetical protein VCUG_01070 [Vavraia culicis subsp. floridensis]